ncbi:MAG: transposase [Bacteroidota bacterium]|nr:transposase [Bacteroidota bacterium]
MSSLFTIRFLMVFFKLNLAGYLENLNSDRKNIAHVELWLNILFFLGYDLNAALRWHSAIGRTRGLLGKNMFKALCKQVLALCVQKGILSGKRQKGTCKQLATASNHYFSLLSIRGWAMPTVVGRCVACLFLH